MQYADYPPLAQVLMAVRDCGVLRVSARQKSRYWEAIQCGMLNLAIVPGRPEADLTLSEVGRIWLRELGINA